MPTGRLAHEQQTDESGQPRKDEDLRSAKAGNEEPGCGDEHHHEVEHAETGRHVSLHKVGVNDQVGDEHQPRHDIDGDRDPGVVGRVRGGGDDRQRLVGVVGADGVGHDLRLAQAARVVGADDGVRAVELVGQRLADVVHQRRPPGQLRIEAQLVGHHAAEEAGLDRVLPLVLGVAGAVVEAADQPDDVGVRAPGSPAPRRPAARAPTSSRSRRVAISRATRVTCGGIARRGVARAAGAPAPAGRPRAPRRRAPRAESHRGARRAPGVDAGDRLDRAQVRLVGPIAASAAVPARAAIGDETERAAR